MGVIIACLAAEIDGRFNSAVYILGGGDPANMLWDSKSLLVQFYRRAAQKKNTLEQLRKKWEVIDPINYVRQNVDHVLMINAKYDTAVRPLYSKKLWEALDRPPIKWLRADHFTSIIFMPFMNREAARFFEETL